MSSDAKYPIREVSRVTGVNAVTLRAWQRRYGLLRPQRTDKGHRLYSDADISRIRQIQKWLERGMAIGKVKGLLELPGESADVNVVESDDWQVALRRMGDMINSLDQGRFDAEFNSLIALYPFATLKSRLLLPLLGQFGWSGEAPHPLAGVAESWIAARLVTRVTNGNQHNNLDWIHLVDCAATMGCGLLLEAAELSAGGYRISLLGPLRGKPQLLLLLAQLPRLWLVASHKPAADLCHQLLQLNPEQLTRLGMIGPVWQGLGLPKALLHQWVDGAAGVNRVYQQGKAI